MFCLLAAEGLPVRPGKADKDGEPDSQGHGNDVCVVVGGVLCRLHARTVPVRTATGTAP